MVTGIAAHSSQPYSAGHAPITQQESVRLCSLRVRDLLLANPTPRGVGELLPNSPQGNAEGVDVSGAGHLTVPEQLQTAAYIIRSLPCLAGSDLAIFNCTLTIQALTSLLLLHPLPLLLAHMDQTHLRRHEGGGAADLLVDALVVHHKSGEAKVCTMKLHLPARAAWKPRVSARESVRSTLAGFCNGGGSTQALAGQQHPQVHHNSMVYGAKAETEPADHTLQCSKAAAPLVNKYICGQCAIARCCTWQPLAS
ncbi:hypothetical protein HaLaN_04156 [Haematococcus lacustris]|uniref:Uncharacterized protein n=1 Tax=Haematococcus lacustris TaxID=44745 RepID=A0A699YG38_HAELA|nr:hypothetical protein HaLaN_04156 [Haematococcus lacustris]